MKHLSVILFFGIFFAIYALLNYYVFIRGLQALPPGSPLHGPFVIVFLFLALSFIVGRLLERVWLGPVSETLVWTGSFWLAALLYFIIAILILDLLRTLNAVVPFLPLVVRGDYALFKERTAFAVAVVVALILLVGHINAIVPAVRRITINVPKRANGASSFTIAAASDIHLGTIIGRKRFDRMIRGINALHADIVLLPGDIVDEDLAPVIKENLGERLRTLQSKHGTVAITGNHEYIGGVEDAVAYLSAHGVTILRDSVLEVEPGVTIAGREDRSVGQFRGKKRKTLGEILQGVDRNSPIVLMDHQPFHLEEAEAHGVDLQLSGHTHHGQLWPLSMITNAIYEVSWGYTRKGNTHYYVSSGVGSWGPPVRTGSRPEIMFITLLFET